VLLALVLALLLAQAGPDAPPLPPVPANFALSAYTDEYAGWVYLAWDDRSQLETRFDLERWQPRGEGWDVRAFTLRANTVEALDVPGPGAGFIAYRLRACRHDGCSPWTAFITATIP
jgi:hypothetical protein